MSKFISQTIIYKDHGTYIRTQNSDTQNTLNKCDGKQSFLVKLKNQISLICASSSTISINEEKNFKALSYRTITRYLHIYKEQIISINLVMYGARREQRGARIEQRGDRREQCVARREQCGARREQCGARREQCGARREQRRARREQCGARS